MVPSGESRVNEVPLAQVSWFSGFPHHCLHPFVHVIAPLSQRLSSRSLAQRLVVDLCICFLPLLEEISSLSGVVDCMLVILGFMFHIHLRVSAYYLNLGYLIQVGFFFSSIISLQI